MHIVNLPSAEYLSQNGFANNARFLFPNKGFYRQPFCGRGGDNRQVADAVHRHIQCTRNRRGRHGENIYFATKRLNLLFLTHAKAMLFIDNHKAETAKINFRVQEFVGANENINLAFFCGSNHLILLLVCSKARQLLDAHGPAGKTVTEVF